MPNKKVENNPVELCPFCQSISKIRPTQEGKFWIIHCTNCSAEMHGRREEEPRFLYLDQHDALIQEWNRRPKNGV